MRCLSRPQECLGLQATAKFFDFVNSVERQEVFDPSRIADKSATLVDAVLVRCEMQFWW